MCLIVNQPRGHTLSRSHLLDIAARNGDGFGIMLAHRGRLHTWRVVGDTRDMLELYAEHAAGRACVLHWRQATHGAVNVENAHPFHLTPEIAVVHNGMLDIATPTRGMSDTWHLCTHVLAPIARDDASALFRDDMAEMLGGMIGSGNKLAILRNDGALSIVNESSGVMHAGRWYSNTYAWSAPAHLAPRSRTWYGGGHYGRTWYDTPRAPVPAPAPTANDAVTAALVEQVQRQGESGALAWCEQHPHRAAAILAEWHDFTFEEARAMVADMPEAAAAALVDIAPGLDELDELDGRAWG